MTGPLPRAEAAVPRAEVNEAALLLSLSARPVIWAGGGAIAAGAGRELGVVADLLAAPVVTSVSGKGVLGEDNPLVVGSLFGASEVARLLGSADAGVAVGTTLSARSTRNGALPLPMQLFHIDLDPGVFGRTYPTRLGIPGDAVAVLEALAGELRSRQSTGAPRDREGQAARVAEVKRAARERLAAASGGAVAVLDALRRAIPPAVPTVWDGETARWAVPLFRVGVPGTFHAPARGAPVGSALATAAAMADSGPVVAVVSPAELEVVGSSSVAGGAASGQVVVAWDGGGPAGATLAVLGDEIAAALAGAGNRLIRLGAT